MDRKVLLHICCGVCALYSIEKLKIKGFSVTGYFYNPNIYPNSEYLRRKTQAEKIADLDKIALITPSYAPQEWKKRCAGLKKEKEKGERCRLCFQLRLSQTKKAAEKGKYDYFTSTLTISPHKNSQMVFEAGQAAGGDRFLKIDFKKENGFKKTTEKAKELNLYRQNYCGCIYSLPDKKRRQK